MKASPTQEELEENLKTPNAARVFYIKNALKIGISVEQIYKLTKIDRWFLDNIKEIVEFEDKISKSKTMDEDEMVLIVREAKIYGFSDRQLAKLLRKDELWVYKFRKDKGIVPTYKQVDTCGAEFEAFTPYYYSTYEEENES